MFIVLFSYKYFCFSGKSVLCKSGICKRSKIVESVSPFQVLDTDLQLGNITVVGVTSKSTAAECGIECDNNENCQVKPLMRNKHRGNREFSINNILFIKKRNCSPQPEQSLLFNKMEFWMEKTQSIRFYLSPQDHVSKFQCCTFCLNSL